MLPFERVGCRLDFIETGLGQTILSRLSVENVPNIRLVRLADCKAFRVADAAQAESHRTAADPDLLCVDSWLQSSLISCLSSGESSTQAHPTSSLAPLILLCTIHISCKTADPRYLDGVPMKQNRETRKARYCENMFALKELVRIQLYTLIHRPSSNIS